MPMAGVEPARYRYHRILSPARLPIPPHRLIKLRSIILPHASGKIKSDFCPHRAREKKYRQNIGRQGIHTFSYKSGCRLPVRQTGESAPPTLWCASMAWTISGRSPKRFFTVLRCAERLAQQWKAGVKSAVMLQRVKALKFLLDFYELKLYTVKTTEKFP